MAKTYWEKHFQNWENQLFAIKVKNFESTSGEMNPIETIIKEIIMPHRIGNIRIIPEFVVLEDAHIEGFLFGSDLQKMSVINHHNSENRNIITGTNKEKKFSLYIYKLSSQDPLE
ncbi:hypothetical protein O181_064149 [Austropuccinia psidii MF-1]|uniref:Uncharacterized protein n=1 Tax=Austropuccinia psidii MF-1 TaxID=1389203 RepID=A0A9Q3ENU5_9BASI|nr:hypothetical protein [Austropuccinia psidii MF-1]